MKSKTASKKPIVNAGVRREVHVKDCMTWPDPEMEAANKENQNASEKSNTFRIQKAALGRPVDRGYTMPPDQPPPCHDDDRAVEALRGWPDRSDGKDKQETNEFEDFMKGYGVAGTGADPYTDYERVSGLNSKKGTKEKKDKKKKGRGYQDEYDAHIADLISHRYMYEAAMKRQQEAEEKERQEAEAAKAMKSRRFPKDIKANKTTQLRSIAMAEKVEVRPQDLWQMPKFKDGAKPALDTKRKKSKGKSGKGSRAGSGSLAAGDVHPTCTCAEEFNGYRGADYDRYQVQDYPTVDYDDNKGADMVPASIEQKETETFVGNEDQAEPAVAL